MKIAYTFLILLLFQATLHAQQSDDNTVAITRYFEGNVQTPNVDLNETTNKNTTSSISINQVGVENNAYINSLQKDDNQDVVQVGSKNNYEYYNYYSQENSNLKINQKGNSNSLQVFGENSLMKNAVINQKSNFKSITVKNYTK